MRERSRTEEEGVIRKTGCLALSYLLRLSTHTTYNVDNKDIHHVGLR